MQSPPQQAGKSSGKGSAGIAQRNLYTHLQWCTTSSDGQPDQSDILENPTVLLASRWKRNLQTPITFCQRGFSEGLRWRHLHRSLVVSSSCIWRPWWICPRSSVSLLWQAEPSEDLEAGCRRVWWLVANDAGTKETSPRSKEPQNISAFFPHNPPAISYMQDILTFTREQPCHGEVPGIRAINAFFRSGFFHLDLFSGAHLCTQW